MSMKVVISVNETKGSIGIQSTDCDPVFETFEGDLDAALAMVPDLVQRAREQWDQNPRYPKGEVPKPPPPPPRANAPAAQRQPAKQAPKSPQQALF